MVKKSKQRKFRNPTMECPCKEVTADTAIIIYSPTGKVKAVFNKDCQEHGFREVVNHD